jgi:HSP20 family protein
MTKELAPKNPFSNLSSLRRDMDRLWDRFFGEERGLTSWKGDWSPTINLTETNNKLVVKTELPGVDPKNVDISVSGDMLSITGEKKEEKEEQDEHYYLMESSYGSFSRSVRLPVEVNEDKIKANYKDGILKITLPKAKEAKKKSIKIDAS